MYQLIYRDIVTDEYAEAIEWYAQNSRVAAEEFVKAIDEKLDNICSNPRQYKNEVKNYYEVSTDKYPYTIVYFIDEKRKRVIVVAIYHHKRHPQKKYRK